jgi:hypothetical protein
LTWILRFIGSQFHLHYDRNHLGEQPNLWCPRTRRLPESVLLPQLPGKTRIGRTSVQPRPWHISPSDRSPLAQCACRSDNEPTRGCDFRVMFSSSLSP